MTALEIRLAIYAAVLVLIAGSILYGRYESERANELVAKDKNAVIEKQASDHRIDEDTIHDLRTQLTAVAAPPTGAPAAPALRLCGSSGGVSHGPATAGAQPRPAPDGGSHQGVQPRSEPAASGGTSGPDVRPLVQLNEDAALLGAIYSGELWQRSVKEAATPH